MSKFRFCKISLEEWKDLKPDELLGMDVNNADCWVVQNTVGKNVGLLCLADFYENAFGNWKEADFRLLSDVNNRPSREGISVLISCIRFTLQYLKEQKRLGLIVGTKVKSLDRLFKKIFIPLGTDKFGRNMYCFRVN